MPRKVFVSYKYADQFVEALPSPFNVRGTCRDYVDVTALLLEGIEIYKGEESDNDLSRFKDTTIRTQLKERIRDSSVTIVMISKGMKEAKRELDQWIPWEIKYSLRRKAYGERRSNSNGMLAVILPDENGSYGHYYQQSGCPNCRVVTHRTNDLFKILQKNMFNKKVPTKAQCRLPQHGSTYHTDNDHSYIHQVKWHDFIKNPSSYIDKAIALRDNIHLYDIKKEVAPA